MFIVTQVLQSPACCKDSKQKGEHTVIKQLLSFQFPKRLLQIFMMHLLSFTVCVCVLELLILEAIILNRCPDVPNELSNFGNLGSNKETLFIKYSTHLFIDFKAKGVYSLL